jgi:broad specificity phosphatase PhoE
VLIYLRHGDDRGNDVYRHDRPLNDRGKHRARKEAGRLIKKYGHPDSVFVSPFRRARETLEAMVACFERPVAVRQDLRLAQRLGTKQQRDPHIRPETLALITLNEDEDAFRCRVADHVKATRTCAATSTVWSLPTLECGPRITSTS